MVAACLLDKELILGNSHMYLWTFVRSVPIVLGCVLFRPHGEAVPHKIVTVNLIYPPSLSFEIICFHLPYRFGTVNLKGETRNNKDTTYVHFMEKVARIMSRLSPTTYSCCTPCDVHHSDDECE